MSRVLIIGSETSVTRTIGYALSAAAPMEYSAGYADTLQRSRMHSFGVAVTNPDSAVDEDLALLEEMRASAVCSGFINAPHEYFDPTTFARLSWNFRLGVVPRWQTRCCAMIDFINSWRLSRVVYDYGQCILFI